MLYMIGFTWLHWMTLGIVSVIALILLVFSLRLKGQTQLIAVIVILLVSSMIAFVSIISLDKVTKKATITKLTNKRVLRTEEISFSGYIINQGEYTIGKSTLTIKLINHGKATGRVKGTDFYRTNSIFGDLFTNKKDRRKDRPHNLSYEFVIAKGLQAGQRLPFTVKLKFPAYFKDVDFRITLQSDLTETKVRIK